MKVNCFLCKKEYELDSGDPQYRKIKNGETKLYTCKSCNKGIENEAVNSTGLDPNLLDPDKKDRLIT